MDEEDKKRLEYLSSREKQRQERNDRIVRILIGTVIGAITLILWYQSSTGN